MNMLRDNKPWAVDNDDELVRLRVEIGRLQRLEDERVAAADLGVEALPVSTFHALTGFRNVQEAREEFDKAGGDAFFGSLGRHDVPLDADYVLYARGRLLHQLPGLGDIVEAATDAVLRRNVHSTSRRSDRGRKPRVSNFHVFLLPFIYLYGGMPQWASPFLPGIGVTQAQFSRLLNVSAPHVAAEWAPHYYRRRSLVWLLQNAVPAAETPLLLHKARAADIVLFIDGAPMDVEKSRSGVEQKILFDWSKTKKPMVRVLVVADTSGRIVEVSSATGGRVTEVTVAHSMGLIERLNEEARVLDVHIKLHFIVDRGFLDFCKAVRARVWGNVNVSLDIPHHLNPPMGRGRRPHGQPKAKLRKQHTADEVAYNRSVAAQRWINESAVGALKRCHLFQRRIDLSVMKNIDEFLAIAAALVNYRIQLGGV